MKEISTGHNPSGAFGLLLFLLFFVLLIKYLKCSPYFHLIFGMICIYCFSSLFGPALFLILNTVIADICLSFFS